MMRGKIMFHQVAWALRAMVAANFVVAGTVSAQQAAPASKPPAAPRLLPPLLRARPFRELRSPLC